LPIDRIFPALSAKKNTAYHIFFIWKTEKPDSRKPEKEVPEDPGLSEIAR